MVATRLLRLGSPPVDHQVGSCAEQVAPWRGDWAGNSGSGPQPKLLEEVLGCVPRAVSAKVAQELLAVGLEDLLQTIVNHCPDCGRLSPRAGKLKSTNGSAGVYEL